MTDFRMLYHDSVAQLEKNVAETRMELQTKAEEVSEDLKAQQEAEESDVEQMVKQDYSKQGLGPNQSNRHGFIHQT